MDDFHLIKNPEAIHFTEQIIDVWPEENAVILICHNLPDINIINLQTGGFVQNIPDKELNFTEEELEEYLRQEKIPIEKKLLNEILRDTNGWAFSVDFIAKSLKGSPGYSGYVRNAMRQNVFKLLEADIWAKISEDLRKFLIRLSLIGHLSAELITSLANGDESLLAEFKQQQSYIHYDDHTDAYLVHQPLIDFLGGKQGLLNDGEKREVYQIAANWCKKNDYIIEMLHHYEKAGDYKAITDIIPGLLCNSSSELTLRATEIFERAPENICEEIRTFAGAHLYAFMFQNHFEEFLELADHYEQRFLRLPEADGFRNFVLGSIYFCRGYMRFFRCTVEDKYDFDLYFSRMSEYLNNSDEKAKQTIPTHTGPWANPVGSARTGAPQEVINAVTRSVAYISGCFNGALSGTEDLLQGELFFYQNDIKNATFFFSGAINKAQKSKQFETVHRALLYSLRIAALQGNQVKAKKALIDMESLLQENEYANRFITYDIALGWYHYILQHPEKIPTWLKESFSQYKHAYFIENFGNQLKARYQYLTQDYPPLLIYIEEMKGRESVLYGRIEMLAMEACVHYQMKDRTKAFAALKDAYEAASPNQIVMPFIELRNDMRKLILAARKHEHCLIPQPWLELIMRRSAYYAKNQTLLISDFKKVDNAGNEINLSPREQEVLRDLCKGLSQTEIATKHNLSVSYVKTVYKNLRDKLQANNIAEIISIAKEKNLV